jgi:hypothetical protein
VTTATRSKSVQGGAPENSAPASTTSFVDVNSRLRFDQIEQADTSVPAAFSLAEKPASYRLLPVVVIDLRTERLETERGRAAMFRDLGGSTTRRAPWP